MIQLLAISLIFVEAFSLTPAYYLLRGYFLYYLFLGISLLFPWIAYELMSNGLEPCNTSLLVAAFSPLLFMILFKWFDKIIQKRYNRHLYFHFKGYYFGSFRESWLDLIFQLSLSFSPFLIALIGKLIFSNWLE